MRRVFQLFAGLQSFAVITAAYVICHGLTAWVVTPVQGLFLPEVTVFASLVYLPHGVRVLAVWLLGWRAVLPLAAGAFLSELIFTDAGVRQVMESVLLQSIAVSAVSAFAAFEIARMFGWNLYAGQQRRIAWTSLLAVGALASLINSSGQSVVFSGLIFPGDQLPVMAVYAAGDLIGLAVCMLALTLIFRWIRLAGKRRCPQE
ncbi:MULTISPECIES: hypothetical protein [unclassified Leisingera]|uniref:hypothetical protein n=1 Tax=unclassified Leisingera TaxID=2614906 RepID=UPI00037357A7|nr:MULTISPECIES: hypothetical protein [unclassified Leisingera]KIC23320.1 hypothetical protein RA23_14655 [Leisingera sp. ANG-S3]KIC49357.1 hypothetical protein RA22_21275 [Leisingera sp. ANG-S]KID08520.1 hypothetical protein GC1_15365 [Leisingera sp. ANG1]